MSTAAAVGIVLHEVCTCERNLVYAQSDVGSPGPLPNVSPYMVPMCVLVGAGLSESHIYCVYIQVFVYVCPHAVMAWQVLTKMADVLTITFMLYAMQKQTQDSRCRKLAPCSVAIDSVFIETMHYLWM